MTGLRKELSFAGENPKGNKEISALRFQEIEKGNCQEDQATGSYQRLDLFIKVLWLFLQGLIGNVVERDTKDCQRAIIG